jgi:hypothetical protein
VVGRSGGAQLGSCNAARQSSGARPGSCDAVGSSGVSGPPLAVPNPGAGGVEPTEHGGGARPARRRRRSEHGTAEHGGALVASGARSAVRGR